MSESSEVQIRRRVRWLSASAVAVMLAAGIFTGSGLASADEGTGSNGGVGSPSSSSSDTSSRGEDPPSLEEPSTLPPGARVVGRTLDNVSRDLNEMAHLRLQSVIRTRSRLLGTLTNMLHKASETAQTVTQNIK
jgi:hypothetical protein